MFKKKLTPIVFVMIVLLGSVFLFSPINAQAVIEVSPGQELGDLVDSNPAGTQFLVKAGLHRLERSVTPKTGMTFIGEYGAILSGSKLLTEFVQEGELWYAPDQTQRLFSYGSCESGWTRCNKAERLYIDNTLLPHVDDKSKVTADSYYFDYENNRIYFGVNPAGKTIEAARTGTAFQTNGSNNDVTIKNLVIEKFGSPAQLGAIRIKANDTQSTGWIVENCEVRLNAGNGISVGSEAEIRYNHVHHNGQLGIGGGGNNSVIEYNDISYNKVARFSSGWEGGGTKFASDTYGVIIRGNYAHHNYGAGLWADIDNRNIIFEDNISVENVGLGIQQEISISGTIRNNYVKGNARSKSWLYAAQIIVQNSSNTEVYGNTVVVEPKDIEGSNGQIRGIGVINQDRGSSSRYNQKFLTYNANIHDNNIYAMANALELMSVSQDMMTDEEYQTINIDYNNYYVLAEDTGARLWGSESNGRTWDSFRSNDRLNPFEQNGELIIYDGNVPEQPAWDYNVGPQAEESSSSTSSTSSSATTSSSSSSQPFACAGDYTRDGEINAADFSVFAEIYFIDSIDCNYDLVGNNCQLDGNDFSYFASRYKQANVCN